MTTETLGLLLAFGIVCLASHRIGRWCTRVGLPYITGYLGTGAIAGAFVLDLLPAGSAEQLRFVDEVSLGVIAFVAGSELYLPDLRRRLRPILSMAGGVTVVGSVVIGVAIYVLTGLLSFTADLDTASRVATAMLGASVLLALSPPSTIAVIKEVGARGPFTSTVLSVTIVMDVVVVVAFATAASIAAALVRGTTLDVGFVGVLALDLALAIGLGVLLGRALGWVLGRRLDRWALAAVVLLAGFGVYELADLVDAWSVENLPFEVYLEPLLLTMVAGFTVTNLTPHRDAFEEVLHEVGPAVYVAFFTLTGVSLKLDTLVSVLPAAVALFVVRVVAIAIGTTVGARFAGATDRLRRRSWLALVTQAGIALGLAREAGIQFPELGSAFTTLVIAVVVLNEVLGPLMLKWVLAQVGETAAERTGRSAVVHGEGRSAALLVQRLGSQGWVVRHGSDPADVVADDLVASSAAAGADHGGNGHPQVPDAVIAMGGDDEANLAACAAAVDVGVGAVVARVRDPDLLPAFHDLGVLVVDPTTADVTLMEEAVRSPEAANLVLHADPDRTTERLVVRQAGGRQLRELRIPQDVLVLTVRHGRTTLVPDGFTRIHDGDELTLLGAPGPLSEAAARLG